LIRADYPAPVMKGELNPRDGQLYIAGFNNYASNSKGISALLRMRYTGRPSHLVNGFQAGTKGLILSFDTEVDPVGLRPENFQVKRWNYRRTEQYGSGHYKLNGTPGEETIRVISVHLSKDRKHVLLVISNMQRAEQMEIQYNIHEKTGRDVTDNVWLTINDLSELKLNNFTVSETDLNVKPDLDATTVETVEPASVKRGFALFQQKGCNGCHSSDNKTMGMYGPPLGKLFGSVRQFNNGASAKANEAYIKESIMEPSKKIVKGYEEQMPSFKGILSESDIESIVMYIKSLGK
jgi:mono/diheme cytochrome c family protein